MEPYLSSMDMGQNKDTRKPKQDIVWMTINVLTIKETRLEVFTSSEQGNIKD